MTTIEKILKEEGLILALSFRCLNHALLTPSPRSVIRKILTAGGGCSVQTCLFYDSQETEREIEKERWRQTEGKRETER